MKDSIELQNVGGDGKIIMPFEDDGLRLRELIGNDIFVW